VLAPLEFLDDLVEHGHVHSLACVQAAPSRNNTRTACDACVLSRRQTAGLPVAVAGKCYAIPARHWRCRCRAGMTQSPVSLAGPGY
jgi:hypothetical protein